MNTDCVKHPEPSLNCLSCGQVETEGLCENCRKEILRAVKSAVEINLVEGFNEGDYL